MALGLEGEECSLNTLRARLSSDSVWTIDLAYLLADFGIQCEYYSATCDVNEESYGSSSFYAEVRTTIRLRLRAPRASICTLRSR